jgi:hypothetical protein
MQGRCADGTQGDGAVRGVVIEWYRERGVKAGAGTAHPVPGDIPTHYQQRVIYGTNGSYIQNTAGS